MSNSLAKKFDVPKRAEVYNLYDASHLLEIYVGFDRSLRPALVFVCDDKPGSISSSNFIDVEVRQRKDNRWAITFILTNMTAFDIFCCFCEDIIETSRHLKDSSEGSAHIVGRYIKWQKMLARSRGELLTDNAIKGLIGEILFLLKYLIPKYGEADAVAAWVGPKKTDQDFVLFSIWYEVKSTDSGSASVGISSIEQLDMASIGMLAIMYLDKTSVVDKNAISLNSIVDEILRTLDDDSLREALSDNLFDIGYIKRPEYDEKTWRFNGDGFYSVDVEFPCLRRKNIPASIVNAKYQLSLASIEQYKTEWQ